MGCLLLLAGGARKDRRAGSGALEGVGRLLAGFCCIWEVLVGRSQDDVMGGTAVMSSGKKVQLIARHILSIF